MGIGIIGYGIVGKAVEHAFKNNIEIYLNDPKYTNSTDINYLVTNSRIIFLCVPTPMDLNTGKINTEILDSILLKLNNYINKQVNPIICIKSTVTPDKLQEYHQKYKFRLVMCPEFLTEKNYLHDMINMKSLIIGGKLEDCLEIVDLFKKYSNCNNNYKIGICDLVGASLVKYITNCFLATKVIFMNQMYNIVKLSKTSDSWEHIIRCVEFDNERIGNSHSSVPGPDGEYGFGGKCLVKDLNAIVQYAKDINVNVDLLQCVNKINIEIREYKDWLNIEGAII